MTDQTVPEPRTAAALAARRSSTQAALDRVHNAISRLRKEKTPVSVAAVGRRAGVSSTFLYANADARSAVAAAIADADEQRGQALADLDDQHEATWRERALNAEDALKAANAEILNQRTRIGELLGQIRDLQAEWTEEAIQRITTETTVKQRVRQLTTDNRTLEERLRVADLEAKLADPATITRPRRSTSPEPAARPLPPVAGPLRKITPAGDSDHRDVIITDM
ncbi:DUF6262 family protein [Saccharopolyspora pogona]|uniref:DUF6262 family protein n=1 Tax=Saccharopolyspora pogona TaxID=333966 RepID=UPI001CC25AFB|nr:DUF6262 family protein [Saccharopolyspora pogona]